MGMIGVFGRSSRSAPVDPHNFQEITDFWQYSPRGVVGLQIGISVVQQRFLLLYCSNGLRNFRLYNTVGYVVYCLPYLVSPVYQLYPLGGVSLQTEGGPIVPKFELN